MSSELPNAERMAALRKAAQDSQIADHPVAILFGGYMLELLALVDAHVEAYGSQRALVRELDVLLNGDGAAKQASLCDIVAQVEKSLRDDVKPYEHGPGTLEVGLSKDLSEVVVNHPCLPLDPRGGHLVFSPQQARDFASLLMLKADQAEGGKS